MAIFMFIISILVFLVATAASLLSKTAVNEIYGAVLGVVSAVFFIGAAIVEALNRNHAALLKQQAQQNYRPPEPGAKTKACNWCDAEISATASVCPKCGKVL